MVSIQECAYAIGIPVDAWPGNCYCIANKIMKAGLVEGDGRYGLFLGEIADTSCFVGPMSRHGWIETSDGGIFDPTRWVFEDVEPYLFVCGPDDERVSEYDVGGSTVRTSTNNPPPEYTGEKLSMGKTVVFPSVVDLYLEDHFGRTDPCKMQLFWLANQSPIALDFLAEPIYSAFVEAGLDALIPLDFRQVVFGNEY